MAIQILNVVIGVIGSAMALYGAILVLALSRPLFFYQYFAARARRESKLQKIVGYFLIGLKLIALARIFLPRSIRDHRRYPVRLDYLRRGWRTGPYYP